MDSLLIQNKESDVVDNVPLIPDSSREGGLTFIQASFFMVGQMIGIGMLGAPTSTGQSGWFGLILLSICWFYKKKNVLIFFIFNQKLSFMGDKQYVG